MCVVATSHPPRNGGLPVVLDRSYEARFPVNAAGGYATPRLRDSYSIRDPRCAVSPLAHKPEAVSFVECVSRRQISYSAMPQQYGRPR
jgi:hypothetical protein